MKTTLCCAGILLATATAWSQDCYLHDLVIAPEAVSTQTVLGESGVIIPDRHVLTAGAVEGALQPPTPLGILPFEDDEDLVLLQFPAVAEATGYWIYRETLAASDGDGLADSQLHIDELDATVGLWGRVDTVPELETLRVAVDAVSPQVDDLAEASVWGVRAVRQTDTESLLSPLSWAQIESASTSVDPASWAQVKGR